MLTQPQPDRPDIPLQDPADSRIPSRGEALQQSRRTRRLRGAAELATVLLAFRAAIGGNYQAETRARGDRFCLGMGGRQGGERALMDSDERVEQA